MSYDPRTQIEVPATKCEACGYVNYGQRTAGKRWCGYCDASIEWSQWKRQPETDAQRRIDFWCRYQTRDLVADRLRHDTRRGWLDGWFDSFLWQEVTACPLQKEDWGRERRELAEWWQKQDLPADEPRPERPPVIMRADLATHDPNIRLSFRDPDVVEYLKQFAAPQGTCSKCGAPRERAFKGTGRIVCLDCGVRGERFHHVGNSMFYLDLQYWADVQPRTDPQSIAA